MDLIREIIDLFLHLDKHLQELFLNYGTWVYSILALTIFVETGLVIMPFLPGDSLLFAAGTMAGRGALRHDVLFITLSVAAVLGDTVNYWIGKYLGPRLLRNENSRILKKSYLDRTHRFFEKYGGKTIILARFVPIVRTFAPFVAGVGVMTYRKFFAYNVIGGVAWVAICLYAGFFFGSFSIVQNNFTLVVLGIIFVSILPGIIEYARYLAARRAP